MSGRKVNPIDLSYRRIKRAIDLALSFVLLVAGAPILGIGIMAVWLDTGRPVFHRRTVIGLGGRTFDAIKLRTMVVDADRLLQNDPALRGRFRAAHKLVDDPRVTSSGRWLRRTSIDELPQLLNVLRGDMSLVGPRMITPAERPDWGETADLLLTVRPGVTGLWQVRGRQRLPKADRIRLDGQYIREMSFRLDLDILIHTVPAVLAGRGAY